MIRYFHFVLAVASLTVLNTVAIASFNALPVQAQGSGQNKKAVGKVECSGVNAGTENSRIMSKATLAPTSTGYELRMVEEWGEMILQLDNKLVVVDAGTIHNGEYGPWNLTGYSASKDPFKIKTNGSFDNTMMVSTRSLCRFRGTVTFLNGAEKKLFGSRRTN